MLQDLREGACLSAVQKALPLSLPVLLAECSFFLWLFISCSFLLHPLQPLMSLLSSWPPSLLLLILSSCFLSIRLLFRSIFSYYFHLLSAPLFLSVLSSPLTIPHLFFCSSSFPHLPITLILPSTKSAVFFFFLHRHPCTSHFLSFLIFLLI